MQVATINHYDTDLTTIELDFVESPLGIMIFGISNVVIGFWCANINISPLAIIVTTCYNIILTTILNDHYPSSSKIG